MTTNNSNIPAIEQAAIGLLTDNTAYHPVLAQWVQALCTDADEQRTLTEFPIAADVSAVPAAQRWFRLPQPGVYRRENLFSMIMDCDAFDPDVTWINGPRGLSRQFAADHDAAVAALAAQLQRFRAAGRADGQETALHGVGGAVATLSTSLAAEVVFFHKAMVNAWLAEHRRREDGE